MAISDIFTKKITVGLSVTATILAIIGGIWTFDSHYATAERVDKVEVAAKEDVIKLEKNVASALQNQQYKADIRYLQFLLSDIQNQIYEIKKQMRDFPNDQSLKGEYEYLLQRQREVKEKLDNTLHDIKVN